MVNVGFFPCKQRSAGKSINLVILIATMLPALIACGPNLMQATADIPPEEQAARDLELDKNDHAISILSDALGEDAQTVLDSDLTGSELSTQLAAATADIEKGPVYLSLLSAAYAQTAGLDPLNLMLKMATQKSDEEAGAEASASGTSGFNDLFPVLPEASSDNINNLSKALAILYAIPAESYTVADVFKQGIMVTALMALRVKALDADGDGQISMLEAINLDASSAIAIMSDLASAAVAMAAYAGVSADESSVAATAAEQLSNYQSSIDGQSGASDAEKLQNFIAGSGATP